MRLDELHKSNLLRRGGKRKRHKTPGDITKEKPMDQWKAKPTQLMPSMHEVPHMDNTSGYVPRPGKPVWNQARF